MMKSENKDPQILVLGIGNVLMGDEGIGVHAVRAFEKIFVRKGVKCLDGGTGSFNLLGPMKNVEKVILIDATIDGGEAGTVHKLRPRYSKDYPRTLTAHDIGLKDLLDAFYLLGETPDVTLFAVSIPPLQSLSMELSNEVERAILRLVELILEEINQIELGHSNIAKAANF